MPLIAGNVDDQSLLKRTRSRRESTWSRRDSALILKKHPRTSWSKTTTHHLPTDDDHVPTFSYEDKPLPSLPPTNPSFQLAKFLRTTGPSKDKSLSSNRCHPQNFAVQNSRYFPFRNRTRRQAPSDRTQDVTENPVSLSSATIHRKVTKKGSRYLEIALNVAHCGDPDADRSGNLQQEGSDCNQEARDHQKPIADTRVIEAFYDEPEVRRAGFDQGHRGHSRQSSWSSIDDLAPDFFSDPWIVQLGSQDSQDRGETNGVNGTDPLSPTTGAESRVARSHNNERGPPPPRPERPDLRADSAACADAVALALRQGKGAKPPLSRYASDGPTTANNKAPPIPDMEVPERHPGRSSRLSDHRRTMQLYEQDRLGSRFTSDHPAPLQSRRSMHLTNRLSYQLPSDHAGLVSMKAGSIRSSTSSYTLRPPSGAPTVYNVSEKRLSTRRSSLNQFAPVQPLRRGSAQGAVVIDQSSEERLRFLERKNKLLEAALSAMLNSGAQVDGELIADQCPLEVFMRQNAKAVAQHAHMQLATTAGVARV